MGTEIPIKSMFSAACYQFVRSIGKDTLIPTPSVDQGDRIKPFQVAIKTTKRRFIFWEKAYFEPTDFKINDVMTDMTPLKVQPTRTTLANYNGTTKLSLSGKFGADICKEILDVELETKDSISLSIQFGKVIKTEAHEPSLLEELNTRNINLDHPLVQKIKERKNKVLCLISGVASLDAGGTIHRVTDVEAATTVKESLLREASVSGETTYDKDRNLGLPPGTPVAYNIHELNVDKNNGAIQLVLTSGSHGGFKCCVGYDEVDATSVPASADGKDAGFETRKKLDRKNEYTLIRQLLQKLSDQGILYFKQHLMASLGLNEADLQRVSQILHPMFELPEEKASQLQDDLLFFLSMPRDITLLADIFNREEGGQIVLKASEVESKLLSPRTRWMSLLAAVGFTLQEDKLQPPSNTTLSESVAILLDAATLLEDETLELLRFCSLEAEALTSVLKDGIRGKATSDPAMVKPILGNPSSQKLLLDLQFRLEEAEIHAPVELTGAVDGAFWLIVGLWGRSFYQK